jgi:hypothetical protein
METNGQEHFLMLRDLISLLTLNKEHSSDGQKRIHPIEGISHI